MLLLIDAGNSNVKWATISSEQKIMQFGGVFSITQPTENIISCFEKNWGRLKPTHVQISHVGSELFPKLCQHWMQAIWQIQATYLKTERQRAGLVNGYSDPLQLGVDRWLALLAAHCFYKQTNKALCIVDSGTCVKIDILTAEGTHLGGSILPGQKMMIQSVAELLTQNGKIMQAATEGMFEEACLISSKVAQKNTLSGLVAGVRFSQAAVIEKLCRDLPVELGTPCQIILTGRGGCALASSELSGTLIYSPHLVLKGIVACNFPHYQEKNMFKNNQKASLVPE